MAIEENEPRDRETWSNVARLWYNKSVDKNSTVGRLYHHLGVLARPYPLEQLSLYMRALTSITPFEGARASIMILFNPILQDKDTAHPRPLSFETVLILAHGILFISQPSDSPAPLDKALEELENGVLLEKYISRDPSTKARSGLEKTGVYAAVSNIAALFGTPKQGNSKSRFRLAYENAQSVKEKPTESNLDDSGNLPLSTGPPDSKVDDIDLSEFEASTKFISKSSRLAFTILAMFLKRTQNQSVYPLFHVYLTFIWSLVTVQQAWSPVVNETVWKIIEKDIPWVAICSFLNTLLVEPEALTAKVWAEDFPKDEENGRPLQEDFMMRGQFYTLWYFPLKWFTDVVIDHDERILDPPSMVRARRVRLLWLGNRIAEVSFTTTVVNSTHALQADLWIRYNKETKSFEITDHVKEILNAEATLQPEPNDRDSTIWDVATDPAITQYTPSECSTMPRCLTPSLTVGTTSNAPSESHDDGVAPRTGGSTTGQNKARTAEFIRNNAVCLPLDRLQSQRMTGNVYTTGREGWV